MPVSMIHFSTIPLRHDGTLDGKVFQVPDSPSTEELLNNLAKAWKGKRVGSVDPELELYNFVANRWPFINLMGRSVQRPQLPLTFSLSSP